MWTRDHGTPSSTALTATQYQILLRAYVLSLMTYSTSHQEDSFINNLKRLLFSLICSDRHIQLIMDRLCFWKCPTVEALMQPVIWAALTYHKLQIESLLCHSYSVPRGTVPPLVQDDPCFWGWVTSWDISWCSWFSRHLSEEIPPHFATASYYPSPFGDDEPGADVGHPGCTKSVSI